MIQKKSISKYLLPALAIVIIAIAGAVVYKIYDGHYNVWLYDYFFNQTARGELEGIIDVIFVHIDHWEPGTKVPERNLEIINTWMREYRKLADKHIDSDGNKLQHTFFYPLEQFAGYQVDSLVQLCREGYGDVEVHLHHQNDTPESLRKLLRDGIDSLQAHGALISPDGKTCFAFVHGNWALDNSRLENGKNFCGVNSEISILLELGCYADFTFPALNSTAQPSLVNKIYYATDNPDRPKSYDTGIQSRVGIEATPEQLMIFQGPMMINWNDWRFGTHPAIDDGDIYRDMLPSAERFDLWVKADIHVLDGPNWMFIRPHTHGCSIGGGGIEANLGPAMDEMLTAVEKKYRDDEKYRLHYMTAREAYNVTKAAEDGMTGNPNDYRDYIIKPYLYVPQKPAGNL
jgi:hypothetical protein